MGAAALLLVVPGLPAQDVRLADRDSGAPRSAVVARGMLPISETTVMQYVLEEGADGRVTPGYVLLIRGPWGWWRQPTGSATERTTPDTEVQRWTVGPLQYTVGYNPAYRRLLAFGQMVNLGSSRLVFATLGPTVDDPVELEVGPPLRLARQTAGTFVRGFLADSPAARSFAGLP